MPHYLKLARAKLFSLAGRMWPAGRLLRNPGVKHIEQLPIQWDICHHSEACNLLHWKGKLCNHGYGSTHILLPWLQLFSNCIAIVTSVLSPTGITQSMATAADMVRTTAVIPVVFSIMLYSNCLHSSTVSKYEHLFLCVLSPLPWEITCCLHLWKLGIPRLCEAWWSNSFWLRITVRGKRWNNLPAKLDPAHN